MAKFIYLTGEGDYSAVLFENSEYSVKDIYNEMIEKGVTSLTKEFNDEEWTEEISFDLLEFGDVDPKFESFVLNEMCDYDALKASTIYRVEE
jgi:hypothetical protein